MSDGVNNADSTRKKGKPRGRPFLKGNSGRKKGSRNKSTSEVGVFFREFFASDEYRENLKRRILRGEANHIESLGFQYAFGRPNGVYQPTGGLDDHDEVGEDFITITVREEPERNGRLDADEPLESRAGSPTG